MEMGEGGKASDGWRGEEEEESQSSGGCSHRREPTYDDDDDDGDDDDDDDDDDDEEITRHHQFADSDHVGGSVAREFSIPRPARARRRGTIFRARRTARVVLLFTRRGSTVSTLSVLSTTDIPGRREDRYPPPVSPKNPALPATVPRAPSPFFPSSSMPERLSCMLLAVFMSSLRISLSASKLAAA